eukprot:NODE_72_length_24857_cov_0.454399.p22 type:complete len:107 gc:universal NODE_72_length_24857_cov_0.454399:8493-8813(+)
MPSRIHWNSINLIIFKWRIHDNRVKEGFIRHRRMFKELNPICQPFLICKHITDKWLRKHHPLRIFINWSMIWCNIISSTIRILTSRFCPSAFWPIIFTSWNWIIIE